MSKQEISEPMREVRTMPKVWCAAIECKHNKRNICREKEINLTAGYINTVYQGHKHTWGCRSFEEDEESKELRLTIERAMRGENHESL